MELRIALILVMAILNTTHTDEALVRRSVDTSEYDLDRWKDELQASKDELRTSEDGQETAQEKKIAPEFTVVFDQDSATALQSDITVLIRWSKNTEGDRSRVPPTGADLADLSVSLQHLASGELVDTLPVPVPARGAVDPPSVTFLCGSVQQGGRYSALLLVAGRLLATSEPLLVRWPHVFASLPPEARSHSSVVAHVRFIVPLCPPRGRRPLSVSAQLVVSERRPDNTSAPLAGRVTDRYPLRHFYERAHDIRVACDRLDRQGFFQLQLVANTSDSALIGWSNVTRVQWHAAFKLNVRGDSNGEKGGSVFPCRTGVGVYYSRPKCAAVGDVVRVTCVERAAVQSAVRPSTETYIGEKRVSGEVSAMSFSCGMFTERCTKYCFSYMAFGWNGSVHRVKTVCIPSLRLLLVDGGFGPWSQWSPCSGSCGTASRVRYRFCNSPPPRNNGAYCEGEVTQSRRCHQSPCPTTPVPLSPLQRAHVSPTCRCGCDVLLSRGQNYSVAAAADRCPGTSLWRFETSDGSLLSLQFSYFLLNSSSERVQARDGFFSNSELLVAGSSATLPPSVTSSGGRLLLEYRVGRAANGSHPAAAGFIASVAAVPVNGSGVFPLAMAGSGRPGLSAASVLSISFMSAILLVLLGAASYHAWQARRIARRSHSCESLFSSTSSSGGGGGGGGCGGSRHTSVTSVAESAVVLRLRGRRGPRRRRLPLRTSSCDRLLAADWHRTSSASGGGSLPSSPATERRRLAARSNRAQKQPEAIPLSCLASRSRRSPSPPEEKWSAAEEETSPESTAKYRPHTKPDSKRRKELENRRRLLVHSESAETLKPGASESALSSACSSVSTAALSTTSATADQELEFDYYDYHMVNAQLAPGSIFGMDPLQLSLCAYDYDVTPTEELELAEMSELGATEATEVTELAEGATDADQVTELTEADTVTDRTEVADEIQFADDDTDVEESLREDKGSPQSVPEDKE